MTAGDKSKMEEDDPFVLIQKGNAFEAASNHWRSADMYSRASKTLKIRAENISSQLPNTEEDAKKQERRKIISLYRAQSLEYLYKARHCFIEALKFENDQDRNILVEVAKSGRGRLDPICSLISNEESVNRSNIFQTLFSGVKDVKAKEVNVVDVKKEELKNKTNETEPPTKFDVNKSSISATAPTGNIDKLQESMEARLAKLNSSLANSESIPKAPPSFISGSKSAGGNSTEQSKLDNLQRGLKGLGVTLPDNSRNKDFFPENLSDEDQVKLIIQQAQDEVMIEKGYDVSDTSDSMNYKNNGNEDGIDENDSMFEGFEDEEDDIESLLTKAENLVAKTTNEINGGMVGHATSSIPSSAVELAQLRKAQALLLEARLCLEICDAKNFDIVANNEMNDGSTSSSGNGNLHLHDGNGTYNNNNNNNNNTEETDNKGNGNSVRIKARERIEDADECLKDILSGWRKE
ncbi:hypothetical protein ACHAXM_002061 [Skeletonema potamos]